MTEAYIMRAREVLDGADWERAWREAWEAEGRPFQMDCTPYIQAALDRATGAGGPTADPHPPAFAKPLAPLGDWLKEVDEMLVDSPSVNRASET